MTTLLREPLAPPTTIESAPSVFSLKTERHRILQDIHAILTGWYTCGAASISIEGVPAFSTADQCIDMLERAHLSEIQRVYRLLTGNREEKAIVERKCPD